MTIEQLDRNDVDAAVKLYREETARGVWNADKAQSLLMLQDDPAELMRRLAAERAP